MTIARPAFLRPRWWQGPLLGLLSAMLLFVWTGAETVPTYFYPPSDRAWAAACLARMQSKKAVPLLVRLCDDPDGGVRLAAVQALGEMRNPVAVPILERLAADPAQSAVGGVPLFDNEFYGWRGNIPLRQNHNIRQAAQWALVNTPDVNGPREAVVAIAELDALDREAVRRLNAGLSDREYRNSPRGTSDTLSYSRAYEAMRLVSHAAGSQGSAALTRLLGCGNENLELGAAYNLVTRPRDEVLPGVHAVVARGNLSCMTLSACLRVLLKHDPPAARDVARRLVEALKTSDEFARFPHRERPVLQLALTKEDVPILKELRDARTDTKEKEVVEVLLGIVEGRSPPCDFFDLDEVPEAWRAEAIRVYLSALDTKDFGGDGGWKALKAAYWLGRLKVKDAVPGLLRLIQHPGMGGYVLFKDTASYYQPMAGWALVQIAEPATVPKLEEIARDRTQSRYARSSALIAYGRLARAKAVPVLAATLQDEDDVLGWEGIVTREYPAFPSFNSQQEAAAWALADVGGETARAAIVAYLESGRCLTSDIAAAISRLDRSALDAWSHKHLDSTERKEHDWAVGIRYTFFPSSAAPIVLEALGKEPGEKNYAWDRAVEFLQRYPLNDRKVTSELVRLLATDKGESVPGAKPGEPLTCNRRIKLIDAISRQGGPDAEDALLEFAEKGKLAPALYN